MSYLEKEKLIKADIASIENRVRHAFNQGYDLGLKDGKKRTKPLEQEPKTGEWIEHFDESGKWYECDQCHTDWGGAVNYCPNCGAKMESEVDNGNDR